MMTNTTTNVARVVFYALISFILMLSAAFGISQLSGALESWQGCAARQEEVSSDEDAIRMVKSDYLVQKFLEKYPTILRSEEDLTGREWFLPTGKVGGTDGK